jgi:hypothetical protein
MIAAQPAGELVYGALQVGIAPGGARAGSDHGVRFTSRTALDDWTAGSQDILSAPAGPQQSSMKLASSTNWFMVAAAFRHESCHVSNPTPKPTPTPTSTPKPTATPSATPKPTPTATPTATPTPSPGGGPVTALHFTANSNFDSQGNFLPGADGFNLADVGSAAETSALPAGVKGLAWVGLCNGADSNFVATVTPYAGNSKLFGFYLYDEPDPTSCAASNLKAESDWIHSHIPGAKTFIIMNVQSATSNPSYQNTYNPSNSDIDLYGLDPYPCRTEISSCAFNWIPLAVNAAESAGVPLSDIVPVYQTFGGGTWVDDGGGQYRLPTAAEESQLLSTWGSVVPTPVFDYAYSWGSQNGDSSLSGSPALQQIFLNHNGGIRLTASPVSTATWEAFPWGALTVLTVLGGEAIRLVRRRAR